MNADTTKISWLGRVDVPLRLPFLLAGGLVAATWFHGARGLYETTEGRYSECAREMVQAGSWLEPVLNGHPHWTKPPLTYWAIGAPCAVLGPTTWAARLYLIPCFLGTVAAVWLLAFRLWGDRPSARMSATVYATSVTPLIASQAVSTDVMLTAALAVAQACFWEGVRKRSRVAVHFFWFFVGIAFLIKGPPALLVLPAILVVWLRLPRQERRLVRLFAPTAVTVFLIVGLGWYAFEAWRHPELMGYWLKDEVVNRSLSDKYFRNPFFYCNFTVYLPVLLFGSLPWGGWLVVRWRAFWERMRVPGGMRNLWSGLSVEAHWMIWATVFPLAVFMLSRSKMPLYVLPLFVPGSAAMGRVLLAAYGTERWFRTRVLATVCAVWVLFVAGKALSGLLYQERDMGQLYRTLTEQYGVRDPERLAIAGVKPLNGLSYYYDSVVRTVPLDELPVWADAGGERFLLCDPRKAVAAKRVLAGREVEEQVLSRRRRMLRLVGSDVKPASER